MMKHLVHWPTINVICYSYIWQGGRLQPVPASKGDVFRSRSLSPSDKRLLMRFLKACSDAMEGQGHLVVR